jgi:hypothetical protein
MQPRFGFGSQRALVSRACSFLATPGFEAESRWDSKLDTDRHYFKLSSQLIVHPV